MIRDDFNWFNRDSRHAPDRKGEALSIYTGRPRFGKVLLVLAVVALLGGALLLLRP